LTALAGGHAGIDRKADDVTVRTGRIGMLFENRPKPIRLPDRDRPIGFRDDEAELAVLDAGQRVDTARLRTDDRNEFAKHPAEAQLDGAAGARPLLLGDGDADDTPLLDDVVGELA